MVARDFESPEDTDTDNVYELTITATDDDSNSASEAWAVTVDNMTETAIFTIGAIANVTIDENNAYTGPTPTITGSPIGNVTYSLSGTDAPDFTIDINTGVISMISRDFEIPADGDSDNSYEVTIIATDDDNNSASMAWTVSIQDVDESDLDTDGDGTPDVDDAFPNDPNEDTDTDGDGTGDNADTDDDNDGTPDTEDAFPTDPEEDSDIDGDGLGDNADLDDDNNGIDDADEIAAESEPLLIPAEAFTPNGDGINDTWMVPGIDNYPNAKVTVYNRWGHEVFAAINYRNDWRGNHASNSEILPSGSYLYVIDLSNGSAPMRGWLFINY